MVLVLCQLKLCVILPVSMQVHPVNLEKKGFDAALENEIFRTSLNYSYSRTLQIMALASVLGVPIQTVYPDQNHKLLPVYENVF